MSYFKRIDFSGSFEAVICLNAPLPDISIFEQLNGAKIIAADGAADRLLEKSIIPNYIIGDLDSIERNSSANSFHKSKIIKIDEQETNDFEKCLKFAIDNSFQNIMICGLHGGDLEHTLNNWSVLIKFAKKLNLCLYEGSRYALPVFSSVILKTTAGEVISLIPQPEICLSTTGLKWELRNDLLSLGRREGARNVALESEVAFEIISGSLLLFFNARLPFAPVFK